MPEVVARQQGRIAVGAFGPKRVVLVLVLIQIQVKLQGQRQEVGSEIQLQGPLRGIVAVVTAVELQGGEQAVWRALRRAAIGAVQLRFRLE